MTNRLAHETSPYLLQHQNNPVDWYPWGPEALERARREDKPIFLSVGYAACHWCHVMEHESFEDPAVAATLNAGFVSIKVDREERPDIDQIYMHAVQIISGHGGWPMSVFLTPDRQPFYAGTYWPPEPRLGMPGFRQVLEAVADAWQNRRALVRQQAGQVTEHLAHIAVSPTHGPADVSAEWLVRAADDLRRDFDRTHGGFGTRPKFPHSMALQYLLRDWQRTGRAESLDMVRLTLDKMARGGIYDHLAGGFARYSVDQRWLVPHFEKMLYDNALLAGAYLDGFLATGDAEYGRVVRETLDYVLGYMTDPSGGFHSTEDADSEGEEGRFYLWTPAEIHTVLGAAAAERFGYVYDVSHVGNFEGRSILNLPQTVEQCAALRGWDAIELRAELADSRRKLLAVRDRRVRPGKDDKVLTSWNALLIDTLARAAGVLGAPAYESAAIRAADFLLRELRRPDGRLLHTWRHGRARLDAYLDDYAYLANALVSLFELTFSGRWIDEAVRLAELLLQHFRDPAGRGFFYTADDHEKLITREKDFADSSVPSGNAMAATALLRLGRLTARGDFTEAARATIAAGAGFAERAPSAAAQTLIAADMLLGPARELVLVGSRRSADAEIVLATLRRRYMPNTLLVHHDPAGPVASPHLQPLLAGKQAGDAGLAAYVCAGFSCHAPLLGKDAILAVHDG